MKQKRIRYEGILLFALFNLVLAGHVIRPSPAWCAYPLLKQIIIEHNLEALKQSRADDSFRGEGGLLRIRPDIGRSLGMKVFIDQDYWDSKALFEKGEVFLEKAKTAMSSQEEEIFKGEHIRNIAEHYLVSKESTESARKKLGAYCTRLRSSHDERFDKAACHKVMDRLLEESLKKTDYRLRDALGLFYNICQGMKDISSLLTPENVTFVNDVFYRYVSQSSEKRLSRFNLDRDGGSMERKNPYNWKDAVEKEAAAYIQLLEAALEKLGSRTYQIDPLLFFALMKRESSFDPLAVSPVGAAGLTQIMPKTGKGLGMKNIFESPSFRNAESLMGREKDAKDAAMAALHQITEENKLSQAERARTLMQDALALGKKRERLFAEYKRELLEDGTDDRLNASLAIECGLKYFAGLMEAQKGDMSLALASYNAGPHRVKQYKGIPPYEETVLFRNRVLEYYRDYVSRLEGIP
jgi:soluble lytic murein transglycosylase-like protein